VGNGVRDWTKGFLLARQATLPLVFAILGFKLRADTLSHSTSPFLWRFLLLLLLFEIGSQELFIQGGVGLEPWSSWSLFASWVARITGMSYQHLAALYFWSPSPSPFAFTFWFLDRISLRLSSPASNSQYSNLRLWHPPLWPASIPASNDWLNQVVCVFQNSKCSWQHSVEVKRHKRQQE
jgi:hypothetical protein